MSHVLSTDGECGRIKIHVDASDKGVRLGIEHIDSDSFEWINLERTSANWLASVLREYTGERDIWKARAEDAEAKVEAIEALLRDSR